MFNNLEIQTSNIATESIVKMEKMRASIKLNFSRKPSRNLVIIVEFYYFLEADWKLHRLCDLPHELLQQYWIMKTISKRGANVFHFYWRWGNAWLFIFLLKMSTSLMILVITITLFQIHERHLFIDRKQRLDSS